MRVGASVWDGLFHPAVAVARLEHGVEASSRNTLHEGR